MNKHDPYCRSFSPASLPPDQCTWCYVIRQVRLDEYLKAWNEGFGIGFEEGKQSYQDIVTKQDFDSLYDYLDEDGLH